MVYPPTLPPGTRTDATPSAANHASDHDAIVAALQAIIDVIGPDPTGPFGDLSARLTADLDAIENPDPTAAHTFADVTINGKLTVGDSDTDVMERRSVVVETDTRSITPTFTAGVLTRTVEKSGATTVSTIDYTYTSGLLTKIVEVAGGHTITTTLAYTAGVLTGVTKAVTTP